MAVVSEKTKFTPPDNLGTKYRVEEVERFVVAAMASLGVPPHNARALAQVLVAADVRGHYSHGLHRLDLYVNDVRASICEGGASPTIVKESASTALVEGNNGLGPVVGSFCMDLAITKAQATGVGWICAKGSNHYGIAGWYTMKAAERGLVGMSFTNTSPIVVPSRSKKPCLGTNPLSVAAPARGDDSFVLDMATSVVALGKVEVAQLYNKAMPEGWGLDKQGRTTTDPAACLDHGFLLPLGATELHSSYKGFGLGMMVEILCGIMSGAPYGQNLNTRNRSSVPADLSQCFVAIDPSFFASGFQDRMSDFMDQCRNMEPVDKSRPVQVPGDPERANAQKVKSDQGITYHINQVRESWQLAQFLGISPLEWL
ncbi:uncharacterized oxidoreductase YjmC isoform X1 [Procambarus clarkii]|uniref:uncharacterized oxidoreductase YjmC isoform X1 n=1 Tax=Procambarus clarkii TaxID=6728 RepID=UPI001E675B61|nr:uncharacterized oxidoreductase YjmC-like isoform X1 [Procambarus clarkii]